MTETEKKPRQPGAHGITVDMRMFARQVKWRRAMQSERPMETRDRSLNGKARIRARREARRDMKEALARDY